MDPVARTYARCLDPALGTWPGAGVLRLKREHAIKNKKEHAMKNSTLLCAVLGATLATSHPGSARTVFDAGKALRQNCASGAPVGADGGTYTDENGGQWRYLRASDALASSTVALDSPYNQDGRAGFGLYPRIWVNVSGAAIAMNGGTLDADEIQIHPGDPTTANQTHYAVLRFIVPEDGWYSAFLTAHDLDRNATANNMSGAEVRLLANGLLQARGVVALEDYTGVTSCGAILTRRFDFQMPVRRMAAGETLDFVVGANGQHYSDTTGLKAFVTKEDEGRFYDAGLAMAYNVTNSNLNPFGTDALGMWYYLNVNTYPARNAGNSGTATPAEIQAWAPGNLTKNAGILAIPYPRNAAMKGFQWSETSVFPYLCANIATTSDADVAPRELLMHPHTDASPWAALRFRPPRSGLYSASVVVRDTSRATASGADGVMAYLLVSEKLVTNAVVSAETLNSTAHFTLAPRLVAANEPIDIIISPHNNSVSDGTGISAIFRREADAYDAGPSLAALDWTGADKPAHPFADALGGGATWDIGTSASIGGTFTPMPFAFTGDWDGNGYAGYGIAENNGGIPRVMVATNGLANLFRSGTDPDNILFKLAPNELFAHPGPGGSANMCPVVRATVPSDGIYHARAYVRDISQGEYNGVLLNILSAGNIASAEIVSRDTTGQFPREAALDGERLWLRAGHALDATLDPRSDYSCDATGMSVCYVSESGATPSVIHIDITGASDSRGRFSAHTGAGREGWSDWNRWNALRPGAAATAERGKCLEADGVTPRNATVTLARDSGVAITAGAGSGASTLLNNYVLSSGAADTYTLTIGELKANEPYTLWLYSAKGNAAGNALFTVGGVTKGAEGTWSLGTTKMLTRFDVVSDASGVISGTFAAADENGGAFNGLTLVGDLPEFIPDAFILVVR